MNNFKKLFFVLSFSFVFTLVFAPVIVSAQTAGTCTDSGYCNSLGASINTCSGPCKLEGTGGFGLQQCVPLIACSTITTATACSSSAPACSWNIPPATGAGTNVLPSGTGQNQRAASNLKLDNPLGAESVNELVGRVINSVMGIVGSLALLMFVYGGLIWMTSSGSQDKVKKGKDILLWSAVGLIVIFSAYALTKFIINLAT